MERQAHVAGEGTAAALQIRLSSRSVRQGTASATLPNGERCAGEFNTVADHLTWDDERPTWLVSEDSQVGVLVLSCPSGYAIRCDFWQTAEGAGDGKCHDARGAAYALVF